MNLFIELHQQLLKKLVDKNVDFIVIGGYSVIFHGYKRTTGDIDIWLKPNNINKQKLLLVLADIGFDEEEIAAVAAIDFTKHMVFSIWEDPEKVDFITLINLVEYDEADKQKVVAEVDDIHIPFLHLNHLILSKMNTGRIQDKADIEKLQELQKRKEG